MKRKGLLIFFLGCLLGGTTVYGVLSYKHSSGPFRGDTGRPGIRNPAWARPLASPRVRNLHHVSPDLYRGAQPDHDGFVELAGLGIKTVVNLRLTSKDDALLAGTPLAPVAIPAEPWELEEAEILAFLRVVSDPARLPVFVHCSHGADRTGAMTAAYRMVVQGWSKDDAIQEMTEGGFGYHAIWSNLPNTLRALDVPALRGRLGLR
jgi:tyrosine-protein phosphatase SIW14